MNKLFFYLIVLVAFLMFSLGFFGPLLVSYGNTMLTIACIVYTLGIVPLIVYFLIKKLSKEADLLFSNEEKEKK